MKKQTFNLSLGKITLIFIALSVFLSACTRDDDDDTTPTGIPVLSSDITSALILIDTMPGVDYIVDGCITVDGVLLTVNPNVTIQFKSGGCITFADGGALKANGLDTAKITFEGQQHTKGFWKGLYFENSNSANNFLEHVIITDAGGSTTNYRNAALCVGTTPTTGETASRIKLKNVLISNSLGYGMYVSKYAIIDQIDNCTISGCDEAPVQLMASNCDVLDNDNTFTGNGDDYIEINGTMVQNNTSLSDMDIAKLNVPYAVFGELVAEHDVTVAAGTQFIMMANSAIWSNETGTFTATGTSANRIVFSGKEHTKGYWKGMVAQYDAHMTLGYCDIADAGNANNGLSVPLSTIHGAGLGTTVLNITNCNISNGLNDGIAVNDPQVVFNLDIQTSNTFTGIDGSNFVSY